MTPKEERAYFRRFKFVRQKTWPKGPMEGGVYVPVSCFIRGRFNAQPYRLIIKKPRKQKRFCQFIDRQLKRNISMIAQFCEK